jgi:alkyl sulfatase BDS1-like metallo-beta-lactamase superfamily hydrolase
MSYTPKDPSSATAQVNREAVARYDMADRQDFADADRGFIAPFPGPVMGADGHVVFDPSRFDYITDEAPAPDSVNPSLWRQSQIIRRGGLYKVVDGLYQVRNNDIGDLTIVEGDTGLVIID